MQNIELLPKDQLMKFIVGKWISKPIYVVAKLGIPDILDDGMKSIEELSCLTKKDTETLYRVMRALSSVGVFLEKEGRKFISTPMGEELKSGALRSAAIMFNSDYNDEAWCQLLECVKTGEYPFEKAHGIDLSAWLSNKSSGSKSFQ